MRHTYPCLVLRQRSIDRAKRLEWAKQTIMDGERFMQMLEAMVADTQAPPPNPKDAPS